VGRAIVLYALGRNALFQRNYAAARSAFEESLARCRSVGDRWGIARALLGLASTVLYEGDVQRAAILFKESLTLEYEVGNRGGMVMSLAGLTGVAAAQGKSDRAARLSGAVEALEKNAGARLLQYLRRMNEPYLAAVRARLDEAVFDAARAEGSALAFEQAVAYALEDEPAA
jgi:non-specific serine/threonine protein kinase